MPYTRWAARVGPGLEPRATFEGTVGAATGVVVATGRPLADGPPLLLIVTYAIFPSGRRPSGRNLTRVREVAQDRVDGC